MSKNDKLQVTYIVVHQGQNRKARLAEDSKKRKVKKVKNVSH